MIRVPGRAREFVKRHPPLARLARWTIATSGVAVRVNEDPGSASALPADCRAEPPQRYTQNYNRYLTRGGALRPAELVNGFICGNDGNRGDMARFFGFCLIFDQIAKDGLTGDLAELGVYKGNTAVLLAMLARQLGSTAYLLDTFEGFSATDLRGIDVDKRMDFADTSLDAVRALVGEDNVRFIKGLFPGTAEHIPADAMFCLAHIDCDLYAPFRAALEFFYPRVVPGGFLVMHDYHSLHWNGAEQAVDEFFADKRESIIPIPDGAGTVIVRKSK